MCEVPPAVPGVQEEVPQEPRPDTPFLLRLGTEEPPGAWAPTSVCTGKVTAAPEKKKKKILKVTGSRRWGLRGSEEGWGPGTGAGRKEQAGHQGHFETPPPPKKQRGQRVQLGESRAQPSAGFFRKMPGSNLALSKRSCRSDRELGKPVFQLGCLVSLALHGGWADPGVAISFLSWRMWPFTQQTKSTKVFEKPAAYSYGEEGRHTGST